MRLRFWPFRKLTPEQREDREWRRYRNRIASTLAAQGYRGDPVSVGEAFAWADRYVSERRAELTKWRASDEKDYPPFTPQDGNEP